jgi:putative colanic acid biosynthesis UDP-glucose lipid carrier transferase
MNLVVFKKSFPVSILYLLQSISPAVVAAALIPVFCAVYNQRFDDQYLILMALVVAFTLVVVMVPSDMEMRLNSGYLQTFTRIAFRWAVVLGILLFLGFAGKFSAYFSRRLIVTWAVATPLLAASVTVILSAWLRKLLMSPTNVRTAVFAGLNDSSRQFAARIQGSPEAGMVVSGFFDDRSVDRLGDTDEYPLLGGLRELATYVEKNDVAVIFVALPMRHVRRVMDLLDDLKDTTVSVYYVPDIFVYDLIQARTGEIVGTPVVAMCDTPFYGFRGVVKRLTDTTFATLILIPALPIMLVCAILIKLTSPGSVLFMQRRNGLDGHEITVYKFRTMTVSEDGDDFVQAKKDDVRITSIGHILRRYSLDELPQLFNVLQGRMSLVGPRPHPVALNDQYRKMISGYMVRHKVLPGLTGLAQVNGCRGETAELEEMQARIDYDLDYLRNWSPFLDIRILFLTVLKAFGDDKAY